MLTIAYSGRSRPSAEAIAGAHGDVLLVRRSSPRADINWGRNTANSQLNPDISNVTNKRRMRELFAEHGVPMPKLARLHGYERNLPLVGRPDTHTKGRGFWLCSTTEDVRRALRGTRRKRAATHFMEYISRERAPREYRVHIFLGKSIRISEKNFDDDGKYTTAKPQHNVRHVRQAAKDAVKAVGLDFGAVDILANDDECWVLEVNSAPGVGGSMPRLYADVFQRWKDGTW